MSPHRSAVEVDHGNIGAVRGKPDGGSPAKPPCRPRDHADLSGQVKEMLVFMCFATEPAVARRKRRPLQYQEIALSMENACYQSRKRESSRFLRQMSLEK